MYGPGAVADTIRPQLIEHVDKGLGLDLNDFIFMPDIGVRNPRLGELFDADDVEEAYRRMREAATGGS